MKNVTVRNLVLVVMGGVVIFATGCATASRSERSVVACPGCRNVEKPRFSASAVDDGLEDYLVQHECRSCQGALQNFFENGEWKHTCSICKDNPYACKL